MNDAGFSLGSSELLLGPTTNQPNVYYVVAFVHRCGTLKKGRGGKKVEKRRKKQKTDGRMEESPFNSRRRRLMDDGCSHQIKHNRPSMDYLYWLIKEKCAAAVAASWRPIVFPIILID
jgi:hypothetical protein